MWELDHSHEFDPTRIGELEPLQLNDKDWWWSKDFQLLEVLLVRFATVAVDVILAAQILHLLELAETIL